MNPTSWPSEMSSKRARSGLSTTRSVAAKGGGLSIVMGSGHRRVGAIGQRTGQMDGVGDHGARGLRGLVGRLGKILVVDGVHRLADPVGHGPGRQREADVVQALEELGPDVMGT